VLVVDDEVDALEILSWMLTDQGWEVRTASDVEHAVSVGRELRPTLLITDYLLRDSGTGLDLIRELRREDPSLPAVLITGMDLTSLRHQLDELGNVNVLRKPFVWSELREKIPL
jgi:two-component system OmpR family response regulator